jgi:hypothetical protein
MIRLRLADVFKSNYSKFGLARLFGVGSTALAKSIDPGQKTVPDAQKKYDEALGKAKDTVSQAFEQAKQDPVNKLAGYEIEFTSEVSIYTNDENVKQILTLSPKSKMKVESLKKRDVAATTGKNAEPASFFYTAIVSNVIDSKLGNVSDFLVKNNRVKFGQDVSSFKIFLGSKEFKMTDEYFRKKYEGDPDVKSAADKLRQVTQQMPDADFFNAGTSPDGNAIVRSFESTRGRGVAGFITSLGLDYGMGSYPWAHQQGSRAPMIVKISLGFSPITDLPLGLDYDGNIRNPSHPVGRFAGSFGDVYSEISTNSLATAPPPTQDNVVADTNRANGTQESASRQAAQTRVNETANA